MFNRRIHPLVGWVPSIQGLVTNWEVDRIVLIPLRQLLDPHNYARYRLRYETKDSHIQRKEDFPCFIHHDPNGDEILWGATFRITMDFLQMVFGFQLPDLGRAPVIKRVLGKTYLNGALIKPDPATQIEQKDDLYG